MPEAVWLETFYDEYPRVEEAAQTALNESLQPRSAEMLWDLVDSLGLAPGTRTLDVGCGEGTDSLRLAEQFGFDVLGIDPVPRHIELASEALAQRSAENPALVERVHFTVGSAERLPAEDASVDFVWFRDVVVHLDSAEAAFCDIARVLTPGGRVLLYHMVATDLLEPNEAAWLWKAMGVVAKSADAGDIDGAIRRAGLVVDELHKVGSEWGEYRYETAVPQGQHLLHVARLRRARDRYVRQFGEAVYEIMLGDALWHVYAMMGKLSRSVQVLSRP